MDNRLGAWAMNEMDAANTFASGAVGLILSLALLILVGVWVFFPFLALGRLNRIIQLQEKILTASEVRLPVSALPDERMRVIEALRNAGQITAVEHQQMRKKILEGV